MSPGGVPKNICISKILKLGQNVGLDQLFRKKYSSLADKPNLVMLKIVIAIV
jgi:hypothetical protein